jgi:catechol 2,3-dioxygenase-like lactoylglutathione lyase family enzyme
MSLLWAADSFYVGVRDLDASTSWYTQKLGLKKATVELDEGEGCIGLVFPKEIPTPIVLGPIRTSATETTRILYTGDIDKAKKWLSSHGVSTGAIETDRQGTRYFAMQDLEGNSIEVSEEP